MALFVPPVRLAKALGESVVRSQAATLGALLEEIRVRVKPEEWLEVERAAILINGRAAHRVGGAGAALGPDDQVWMVFPAAGG
jgi:molybdopterin converting factor small subunit